MFLFSKRNTEDNEPKYLSAISAGEIISVENIDNELYSSKILGDGYGMFPKDDKICSPASGIVESISDDGHSYNITSCDGLALLVHIGLDPKECRKIPVEFDVHEGQEIESGQHLCTINADDEIRSRVIVEVLVTNCDVLSSLKVLVGTAKDITAPALEYAIYT